MSLIAAIVPCGPGYVERERRCFGFMGCIKCDHFMIVRPDKRGELQLSCLKADGGCKAQINVDATMPNSTAADLVRHADDIRALPAAYREHLARSWVLTTDELEAILNGTHRPQDPAPENPGNPGAPPARNPEPAGSAEPGKPGVSAGKTGNPEPEPAGPAEPAAERPGRPEPGKRAAKRYDLDDLIDDLNGGDR